MRISLVINSLGAGGAERAALELAGALARRGDSVTIHTFREEPPFFPVEQSVAVSCTGIWTGDRGLAGSLTALPRSIEALRRSLQRAEPEIVISFMDQANLLTLIALRDAAIPIIVSERVYPAYSSLFVKPGIAPLRPLMRFVRSLLYRRAAAVVVQTQRGRGYFPPAVHARTEVIPNPIYPAAESDGPMDISAPFVMGLGRLNRQKRFDLLIRSFALVAPEFPEWKLAIFGEGDERGNLERLVAELGLGSRVLLPGLTAAPRAQLRRAEIFALSSDYEGFPGALCEAMAEGRACVAADCLSGPAELIADGTNGLLTAVGDSGMLAERLAALMRDTEMRARLGSNARQIAGRLSPETITAAWVELISRVLKRR